jgi:phage gp29-like protein
MITSTRRTSLTGPDIATRVRALDFNALGLLLPNPDPLLRELGQSVTIYRNIARDPHVGACIRRRKAAVKALEWGLDKGKSRSRVARSVEDMLTDLDMERIIGQMLESVLYGYQPMEITWGGAGGLVVPLEVQAKPPEWFQFDPDNILRLRTWEAPMEGELLPERKFLLPRQDPTYANPYGFSDLSLCYWPVVFKKGGMRFWLDFAEKFGGAWAVGKLPRTATDAERNLLLNGLEEMLGNGIGTIPDDGSVEVIEMAGKSASSDLYRDLVMHCRGEISIVLTGTNQTMEASSNKASAHAGMDVARDLRDSDAEIVTAAVNQLIRWAVEVNWPGADAPVWSMWDQEEQDELQAQRDERNAKSGARFTVAYWERAYGYQPGDLETGLPPPAVAVPGQPAPTAAAEFAESTLAAVGGDATRPTDELASAAAPAWQTIIDQVTALVERASDMPSLQRALTDAYGGLDSGQLVRVMAAAFALAELRGMADVQDEAGD